MTNTFLNYWKNLAIGFKRPVWTSGKSEVGKGKPKNCIFVFRISSLRKNVRISQQQNQGTSQIYVGCFYIHMYFPSLFGKHVVISFRRNFPCFCGLCCINSVNCAKCLQWKQSCQQSFILGTFSLFPEKCLHVLPVYLTLIYTINNTKDLQR